MNSDKRREDLLREAAAFGDGEGVKALIESGVNVNAQHNVNGWTALHWASKRGHPSVVHYLLRQNAERDLISTYGESALSIAKSEEIRQLLSGSMDLSDYQEPPSLPITPNYLTNPPLSPKIDISECKSESVSPIKAKDFFCKCQMQTQEIVLKVRKSDPPNEDFLEVEVPLKDLSYETVFKICCEELCVPPQKVIKLRKLPNTVVRKDKDVLRFRNFEELELVIPSKYTIKQDIIKSSSDVVSSVSETNGYMNSSFQSPENTNLMQKSNYCKNGTILY